MQQARTMGARKRCRLRRVVQAHWVREQPPGMKRFEQMWVNRRTERDGSKNSTRATRKVSSYLSTELARKSWGGQRVSHCKAVRMGLLPKRYRVCKRAGTAPAALVSLRSEVPNDGKSIVCQRSRTSEKWRRKRQVGGSHPQGFQSRLHHQVIADLLDNGALGGSKGVRWCKSVTSVTHCCLLPRAQCCCLVLVINGVER